MTPEQIQELLDRLFEIGGAIASNGWELAIQQVYVQTVGYAIVAAFLSLVLVGSIWIVVSSIKDSSDDELGGSAFIAALFSVVGLVVVLYGLAGRLINPRWYAVNLLIDLVK